MDIDIKEEDLKILFTEEEIQNKIKSIADSLNEFYKGEEVYAICVLKGAVMFAVDLVKHLNMPLKMEFIRLSSYGTAFSSSGKVNAVVKTKSTKFCSLLDKKVCRKTEIEPDYFGFHIDDQFVVGYGLDYEGYYRNLRYIGYVEAK